MSNINLSPYKIVWVEFTPKKGYVTRHDQKQFGAMLTIPKIKKHYKWFTNKDEAMEYLTSFRKPLNKACIFLI